MATCRLELMGLHDASAYRWMSRLLKQHTSKQSHPDGRFLAGLNVPNKKPGEPLIEWASVLQQEFPEFPVCVHYSLKHQKVSSDPVSDFVQFCVEAASVGVDRILLVTGPRGPRFDTVSLLERLHGHHPSLGNLRIGVAFNACLPSQTERAAERERLLQKLKTGLVDDVWLNCGTDIVLLEEGVRFVRSVGTMLNLPRSVDMFGSVLLPNEAQLQQFRKRPWNGVYLGDDYLSSLAGMDYGTRAVLSVFHKHSVEPIFESKVRSQGDFVAMQSLMMPAISMSPPLGEECASAQDYRIDATHIDGEVVHGNGYPRRSCSRFYKTSYQSINADGKSGVEVSTTRRWSRKQPTTFYPLPASA